MKWINYSRFTGDDLGISAEDLMKALSDSSSRAGSIAIHAVQRVQSAVTRGAEGSDRRRLREGALFDDQRMEQMMERLKGMSPEEIRKLVDRLIAEARR